MRLIITLGSASLFCIVLAVVALIFGVLRPTRLIGSVRTMILLLAAHFLLGAIAMFSVTFLPMPHHEASGVKCGMSYGVGFGYALAGLGFLMYGLTPAKPRSSTSQQQT